MNPSTLNRPPSLGTKAHRAPKKRRGATLEADSNRGRMWAYKAAQTMAPKTRRYSNGGIFCLRHLRAGRIREPAPEPTSERRQ